MVIDRSERKREVVFFPPGGQVKLVFMTNDGHAFVEAAKQMKSRYFVSQDDYDQLNRLPVWGVFDTLTYGRMLGQWVIQDPIRTFTAEKSDAAVMFALARTQRGR